MRPVHRFSWCHCCKNTGKICKYMSQGQRSKVSKNSWHLGSSTTHSVTIVLLSSLDTWHWLSWCNVMYQQPQEHRIHTMTITSFAITLYGQCCRRHLVGQQVVSAISVVTICSLNLITVICYYACSLLCLEWLLCFTACPTTWRRALADHRQVYCVSIDTVSYPQLKLGECGHVNNADSLTTRPVLWTHTVKPRRLAVRPFLRQSRLMHLVCSTTTCASSVNHSQHWHLWRTRKEKAANGTNSQCDEISERDIALFC